MRVCLNGEQETKIINDMSRYIINHRIPMDYECFRAFVDDYGWQDWMNEFTDAEDGEPCSESEIRLIDDYLEKLWKTVKIERWRVRCYRKTAINGLTWNSETFGTQEEAENYGRLHKANKRLDEDERDYTLEKIVQDIDGIHTLSWE